MLNFYIQAQFGSVLFREVGLTTNDGLVMSARLWGSEPLINPQLIKFIKAHDQFKLMVFKRALCVYLEWLQRVVSLIRGGREGSNFSHEAYMKHLTILVWFIVDEEKILMVWIQNCKPLKG